MDQKAELLGLRNCYGLPALYTSSTLHIPYKHLSHAPKPVTLRSRLVNILLFTSLNLDYLTFPFFSRIFLFLSRTQHEPLTKLLCQDLAQHNTVYSSFSPSFLSFLSKFLNLYVRSIKQHQEKNRAPGGGYLHPVEQPASWTYRATGKHLMHLRCLVDNSYVR